VESVLGPRGAYKMVTFTRGPERVIKVTKDAVEMMQELEVQYPAVKTLAEAAKIQREQAGDGVSTMIVILAAILRESETLMRKKLHPNVILKGYRAAAVEALAVVEKSAVVKGDSRKQILDVADCGRDLLTPKLRSDLMEACDRAAAQGGIDLKRIGILTRSGAAVSDSRLVRGVMVRKAKVNSSMPDELRDVKVAVVNKTFDNKPMELLMKGKGPFNVKLEITGAEQMQLFKNEERRMNDELVDAVERVGAKVVVCRAKIVPQVADEMSRRGILAFEIVDQVGMDDVAAATGATAVSDIKNIEEKDLGYANVVRVEKVDTIDYFVVEAAKGSTILLRGSSLEDVKETERVVKNVIRLMRNAAKDQRTVLGGAATYMQIATRLREYSLEFEGKEQVAVDAFANAMEQVAVCLIRNYGLRWSVVLPMLRSYHAKGMHNMGVSYGGCADMDELDVRENIYTAKTVLARAYEVTSLLLRVDEYFYVKELPFVHKQE
jgi:chaperonin GroEL (HSP60 family)